METGPGNLYGNKNKTMKTEQEGAGNVQARDKEMLVPVVVRKLNIKSVVLLLLRKRQSGSLRIHKQAPLMRGLRADPPTLTSLC